MFDAIGHSDDRAAWLGLRREGIGGSDAAGVLGVSPWSSPVSVFADKVLGEEDRDSEPMYWGRTLEPVILAHYAKETGREVQGDGRLLRSREHPFMQVTLDGIQAGPDGETGFLEVKNTRFHLRDGVPEHYWIQMQHQFAVTGYSWGSFAVLVAGSEFYWCDVPRDQEFITGTLIPAERAFWERVIAKGPTPPADASDATLAALKRIYPDDDGGTVQLDGEYLDDDIERQRIVPQLADLKAQQQGIDNRFKAAIGEASTGVLPNGRKYTYKARKDGVRVFRAPKPEEEQAA